MLLELHGPDEKQELASLKFWRYKTYDHLGQQGFTTDAVGVSKTKGYAESGYGVCIGGFMAQGKRPIEVRNAFNEGDVSISPLELLMLAAAIELAVTHNKLPPATKVVWRNGSVSAVDVFNKRRAHSRPMLSALQRIARVMK